MPNNIKKMFENIKLFHTFGFFDDKGSLLEHHKEYAN